MNALAALHQQGQSVWLDYIRRSLIESGDLDRLVADGLRGVTSNPSIFEKAITGSSDYDGDLVALLDADPHADAVALYERLAVTDIQQAADALRPVFDASEGGDGHVSLEVSPHLARDTEGTISEAHRLWETVGRPNLMIKVPATAEGAPAIETLIEEGINVNVTLIFSLDHYEAIAEAYLRGLERSADPSRVASVASFFVSRVDTAVDRILDDDGGPEALGLRGTIAVANARLAYRRFQELFNERFADLKRRGARPQRLLWASTGTKNPAYSDVMYIEELVGADTVNTVPPATLEAFRDHGSVRGATIAEDVAGAEAAVERLSALGVDLGATT
ncbi:MAG: transaldolase, partial [Acidimicrobiia bacterium]